MFGDATIRRATVVKTYQSRSDDVHDIGFCRGESAGADRSTSALGSAGGGLASHRWLGHRAINGVLLWWRHRNPYRDLPSPRRRGPASSREPLDWCGYDFSGIGALPPEAAHSSEP